jgi:hypothetical protein
MGIDVLVDSLDEEESRQPRIGNCSEGSQDI